MKVYYNEKKDSVIWQLSANIYIHYFYRPRFEYDDKLRTYIEIEGKVCDSTEILRRLPADFVEIANISQLQQSNKTLSFYLNTINDMLYSPYKLLYKVKHGIYIKADNGYGYNLLKLLQHHNVKTEPVKLNLWNCIVNKSSLTTLQCNEIAYLLLDLNTHKIGLTKLDLTAFDHW